MQLLTIDEFPDYQDSIALEDGSQYFEEKDLSKQQFFSRADPS